MKKSLLSKNSITATAVKEPRFQKQISTNVAASEMVKAKISVSRKKINY
jgi:hypothetical protein